MLDVIQRLRGLKVESDDTDFIEGKKDGTTWAKDTATPAQLRKLDKARASMESPDRDRVSWAHSAFGPAEQFAFIFLDEDDQNRQSAKDFWEAIGIDVHHDSIQSDAYLNGFIEGAQEVWDAVADEI